MERNKIWSWVLDLDLNFLSSDNAGPVIGYEDEELIGTNSENLQVSLKPGQPTLEQLTRGQDVFSMDNVSTFIKGGGSRTLDFIAMPVHTKAGKLIGYRGASMRAKKFRNKASKC